MGIIKAAAGSVGGVLADQWLEVYKCEGFSQGVLAERGIKIAGQRSANTKGEENVISDGSTVIVNAGQCALAIDKGKITGCYDRPGENTYHSDRSGSIFHRGGLKAIAKQSFERFGYGGVAAVYQVIMFLDMKEHFGNPFKLRFPILLTNRNTGASIDATAVLSGMFSFRITEPVTFYQKVCGNSTGTVTVEAVLPQMTAELSAALRIGIAKVCQPGINAYELSMLGDAIADAVTEQINEEWKAQRGFSISSVGIDCIALTRYDKDLLQSVQYAKALTDPRLAAATLVGAQAQALQSAAKNKR